MDIKQSFFAAIRNLCVNKMRFAQTTLAMMIGVAAIVATGNICQVLLNLMEEIWNPESFSVMHMYIATRLELNRPITIEDMDEIAAKYPETIVAVSPFVYDHTLGGNIWYGDKCFDEAIFVGVNENYLNATPNEKLAEGRFIQYMDCRREQNVCVVSSDIANELMGGDALGKTLKIWGVNCTVVGIMEKSGRSNNEEHIYLPYTNALKITGERIGKGYLGDYYSNRFVLFANGVDNIGNARRAVEQEVSAIVGEEANIDKWFLTCASELFFYEAGKGGTYSLGFNLMLGASGVLLVGGVGIMNVMLASVRERTKEIGIRKAFGATNKDIQRQFMLEAIITSLLGGVVGVVLGEVASFAVPVLFDSISFDATGVTYPTAYLDIALSAWPILLALAVSVGVGMIFGTYPARQAAKIEPVVAINEGL